MKTCPKCQSTVSDTAKFCVKCGFNIKKHEEGNVQQEYFCPECGTKFSGGTFCPECGTSIGGELTCETVSTETIGGFDFSALELEAHNQLNEQNLSAFEYEKLSNGKYVIKKLKNSDELIVVVPDCVQVISEKAFASSGVIDVTLPEGLIKIGARAFANCTDLETINLPSSLKIIESEAFLGCTELDLEEPQNVRCGKDAFKNTKPWIKKETERKRKEEEERKRKEEEERKRKEEEERKRKEEEERKRKEEEERKRKYTDGLMFERDGDSYKVCGYFGTSTDVIIPEIYENLPVTSIGNDAFDGYSSLTSITIPNSVTSIDRKAFIGCTSLESITIPNSVTSISDRAFYKCNGLTSITIPNSVTSIGKYAFYSCSSLTSITIPNSVTSIAEHAFSRCQSLTDITYKGTVKQWNAIQKGASWIFDAGDYTIKCSNGIVNKSN